jgi:hypothetical protein
MSVQQQADRPNDGAVQAPRRQARKRVLTVWSIAPATAGFFMWLIYGLGATTSGAAAACGPEMIWSSWSGGGQASEGSVLAAAVIGGALWLAASVAAWLLRSRLGLLLIGFVASYFVGLLALWYLSPLIWGPRFC